MEQQMNSPFASYNLVERPEGIETSQLPEQEREFNPISQQFIDLFSLQGLSIDNIPSQDNLTLSPKTVAPKQETVVPRTKPSGRVQINNISKQNFISQMTAAYTKSLSKKGISVSYAKMLVAQDALESNWGKSLAGKNNFGGIKGKGTKSNTREVINGKEQRVTEEFRDFKSLEDYTDYKVNLLNNKRYHAFDGGDFFANVAKGGYATDPRYLSSLRRIYNSF